MLKYQHSDFSIQQAILIGIRPNNQESEPLESFLCLNGHAVSTQADAIGYTIDYLPTTLKEYRGQLSLALYTLDGRFVKRFSETDITVKDHYSRYGMTVSKTALKMTTADVEGIANGTYELIPEHRPEGKTDWQKLVTDDDIKSEVVRLTNGQFTNPTSIDEVTTTEASDFTFELIEGRTLRLPTIIPFTLQVHTLGGQLVLRTSTPVSGDVKLPEIPAGTYIVSWGMHRQKMVLP